MLRAIMPTLFATLIAVVAVATPAAVRAQTINFKASLKGSDEVPPNGSKGTGTLQGSYDVATKRLSYVVNYGGLTGPATAAHFHGPAGPGQNAGVAVGVTSGLTNPIRGTATLTDAQAADLMAGRWYFNIHTAANKDGEIRGQVTR